MARSTIVKNLDTGTIYPSLLECGVALGITRGDLSAVAKLCGPEVTVAGHRLRFIPNQGVCHCKKKPRLKIRCIETGETFHSAVEAGKFAGRSPNTIYQAARRGFCCGGYHWRYIRENEKA